MEWAQGTRRRFPKLATYKFLNHRVGVARPIPSVEGPIQPVVGRPVRVLSAGGRDRYLPADAESEDEVGHMVIA